MQVLPNSIRPCACALGCILFHQNVGTKSHFSLASLFTCCSVALAQASGRLHGLREVQCQNEFCVLNPKSELYCIGHATSFVSFWRHDGSARQSSHWDRALPVIRLCLAVCGRFHASVCPPSPDMCVRRLIPLSTCAWLCVQVFFGKVFGCSVRFQDASTRSDKKLHAAAPSSN